MKGAHTVANHKSAIKRARQNEERRLRNRVTKTRVKTVTKAVTGGAAENAATAQDRLRIAQSTIDKAAKKGVIHRRAAARKISRLVRRVNAVKA